MALHADGLPRTSELPWMGAAALAAAYAKRELSPVEVVGRCSTGSWRSTAG